MGAASEAASLSELLSNGELEISIGDGFDVQESDDGGATIVAAGGESVNLPTTLTDQEHSYTGAWSVQGGATAVFTVTSVGAAQAATSNTIQPMSGGEYAQCVIETTAAATLASAITGVFTGPGAVATIPVGFLAGFTGGHISCL